MDNLLTGRTIILGITGGIAAYKAATLCSRLVGLGATVRVIMTEGATRFITPLTLQTLSRNPVATDVFDEHDARVVQHIDLADAADLIIVAPATANIIAKLANGLADDMLSTTLLAATAPLLIAPAMNVHMWDHPAVQDNMNKLAMRGARFVEPGIGQLACGYVGKGRLAEPDEIVAEIVRTLNTPKPLTGRKVLVTAGGTVERIDPVRYITNDSSGKMGFALAEAARELGAEVTLLCGKTDSPPPAGIEVVHTPSAARMYEVAIDHADSMDIIIKAAAVADYRPVETAANKIKKTGDTLTIELVKNPDILQSLGEKRAAQGTVLPVLVGFAAETTEIERYASEKLLRKKCDLIIANDVGQEGAGFGTDTNIVKIYDHQGLVTSLPQMSKKDVAMRIIELAVKTLEAAEQSGNGDRR